MQSIKLIYCLQKSSEPLIPSDIIRSNPIIKTDRHQHERFPNDHFSTEADAAIRAALEAYVVKGVGGCGWMVESERESVCVRVYARAGVRVCGCVLARARLNM
jgi:hypothetical protein